MSFKFTPTEIPEVVLVETDMFYDKRGYFSEIYRENIFAEHGIGPFVQQNVSVSNKGIVRGLHFQSVPMEVGKLVSCLSGEIYDVALDLRILSPTRGKHVARVLKPGISLWIPAGFAHGFQALEDNSVVMYRQTQYYSKEHDMCIHPLLGGSVNVQWPLNDQIVISEKDQNGMLTIDWNI
jgi:dTDP-4-dehydrorhamnose 3,5-epimerase